MADRRPLSLSLDVSAVPPRPAGAGRYVVELTRALARRSDVALVLVARRGDAERWESIAPASGLLETVPRHRPARLSYERLVLGRRLRRVRPPIEVHHGPHYTLPGRLGPIGTVATVHDLTFFDHPEWHERAKVPVFRNAIRRAAAEADALVCVSEVTARRLRALLEPAADVFVAPHGVDLERFCPATDGWEADAAVLAACGLDPSRDYLLHLGTIEPRKGVADLVAAFARIAPSHPGVDLVLAGLAGWGSSEVERAIEAASVALRVHRLGFVADEAVPVLLRRAAVVAYPSYEEGFGLPALEAIACGARLVTTEGTAMEEVAGEAAWTAPPGDAEALAVALEAAVVADEVEAAHRRAAGLTRARSYTWDRAASLHLAAYEAARLRAAERSPRPRRGARAGGGTPR